MTPMTFESQSYNCQQKDSFSDNLLTGKPDEVEENEFKRPTFTNVHVDT